MHRDEGRESDQLDRQLGYLFQKLLTRSLVSCTMRVTRTYVLYALKKDREDGSNVDQSSLQRTRRASAPQEPVNQQAVRRDAYEDEGDYDDVWPTRMPSSTRRYHSDVKAEIGRAAADVQSSVHRELHRASRKNAVPPRRTAVQSTLPPLQPNRRRSVDTEEDILSPYEEEAGREETQRQWRAHWLLYIGLALVVMLLGWMVLSAVTNWWQVTQDDWRYGRPRTFQTDAVVGHNDSAAQPSHFIALNLNRHVEIIEFPGGDATKAKVYIGPVLVGPGQDLAPVTLSFRDVNGDGKLDMIVNVQGSHFVFINANGAFRPPNAGENISQ